LPSRQLPLAEIIGSRGVWRVKNARVAPSTFPQRLSEAALAACLGNFDT
jgi:hypothetical protein